MQSRNGKGRCVSVWGYREGTLRFAPGQVQRFVTVSVFPDTRVEPVEVAYVELVASSSGVSVSKLRGVLTIVDDDSASGNSLSVSSSTQIEGDARTRNAVFAMTLKEPASADVTASTATKDANITNATSVAPDFLTTSLPRVCRA